MTVQQLIDALAKAPNKSVPVWTSVRDTVDVVTRVEIAESSVRIIPAEDFNDAPDVAIVDLVPDDPELTISQQ